MPEEKKSATVVVKKIDGTYVRMPMGDFKRLKNTRSKDMYSGQVKIKNTTKVADSTKIDIKVTDQKKPVDVKEIDKKLPTPSLISSNNLSKDDFIFSLEEDVLGKKGTSLISDSRLREVDEILKKLSFSVEANKLGKLRNAVQFCLKDIRSEDQTRELLIRSLEEGGLGLNKKQAEEIINYCREKNVPQVYEEPKTPVVVAAPSNMVKPSFVAVAKNNVSQSKDVLKQVTPEAQKLAESNGKVFSKNYSSEEVFKLSKPRIKPLVRDIISKSIEVGPVEELGSVTLIDFRYLAPTPGEAAARLGQKFANLKAESILLYLDGIEAWRKSSLYTEYTEVLIQSLAKRKPLVSMMNEKQKIQLGEITALVNMEKEFVR